MIPIGLLLTVLLLLIVFLQDELDRQQGGVTPVHAHVRLLPSGEVLKPALLGFHHLGADVLWLQLVQVLGQPDVPASEYEWAFHALDIITTIDPHYVYAYDAGALILAELAGQVEWSNRLLKKGLAANPDAWRLAFQLGFNYFFHFQDYETAADYMAIAATLPGRPAYVPELAARLYVEAKSPDLALTFLSSMRASATDTQLISVLDRRRDEVLLERDLVQLEQIVQHYRETHGRFPTGFDVLVDERVLERIPSEPFGGRYLFDHATGQVSSSTHPQRLRIYRSDPIMPLAGPVIAP